MECEYTCFQLAPPRYSLICNHIGTSKHEHNSRNYSITDSYILTSSSIAHSTDTFYGIICSGLTDKTRLSFISSNSSFSECVRIHLLPKNYYFLHNSECTPDSQKCWKSTSFNNDTKPVQPSSTTAEYDFSFCEWDHCSSNGNGGGICCSMSGNTISLSNCAFNSCSASDLGGAVYLDEISEGSIKNCVFSFCSSTTRAGCIYSQGSNTALYSQCSFIHGTTGDDGGASFLWCVSSYQEFPITTDCRILFCQCTHDYESDPDGGGLVYSSLSTITGVRNTLFVSNRANKDGGALYFPVWKDISFYPVTFCFFHNNYAPYGNDALIHFTDAEDLQYERVFLHSFTTCTKDSLAMNNSAPEIIPNPDNWLPHGIIYKGFYID